MSYFKKFTDLMGGITCFIATVFLISRYMDFNALKPEEFEEGVRVQSKLEQFLMVEQGKDHRQYIILILFLVLSIAASRLLKRIPAVSFCLSVLPLLQVVSMLHANLLYEYKGLYVLLAALHTAGAFYELVFFDRHDNKKRTFVATTVLGVLSAAACFGVKRLCEFSTGFYERFIAGKLVAEDMRFDRELKLFGINALAKGAEDEQKVIVIIMVLLLVSIAVAIILRGAYFIDVILAALPFGYAIWCWHAGKFTCAPMLVVIPVVVYFFARVTLFVTGVGVRTRTDAKK